MSGPKYKPSELDANQVLQHSFDHETQSLRTTDSKVNDLTLKSYFNAITSVPSDSLVVIITLTVPAETQCFLERVEVGGTNIAEYRMYKNDEILHQKRTSLLSGLDNAFIFSSVSKIGILLVAGDVLEIKVIHSQNEPGDFECRIQTVEGNE